MSRSHTTVGYWRSIVHNYFELTPVQQVNVVSNYFNNEKEAAEDSFVLVDPEHSPIPLSQFMRHCGKIWDGCYGTSYFSAYFIKIGRTGEDALVVYRIY